MRSALCCRAEVTGSPPLPAVRARRSSSSDNKRQWRYPRHNEASNAEQTNMLRILFNSQSETAENNFSDRPSVQLNDVPPSDQRSTGFMLGMKTKLERQLSRKSAPFRTLFRGSPSENGARQRRASLNNSNGQQSQRSTWQSKSFQEGGYDSDAVALDIPRDLNELLQPGTPEHGVSRCLRDNGAVGSGTQANAASFIRHPLPGRASPPSPRTAALPSTPVAELPGSLSNHHGSLHLHDRSALVNLAPPSNDGVLPMPPAPMLRPQRLPSLPESASHGSWRLSFAQWRRPSVPFGRSIDRGRRVSAGVEVQKNRKEDHAHRLDDAKIAETMGRPLPEGSGYTAVYNILGEATGIRDLRKPNAFSDATTNTERLGPGSGGRVSLHSQSQHYMVRDSVSERGNDEAPQVTQASSDGEPIPWGYGQISGTYDGGNENKHLSCPGSPPVAAAAEQLSGEGMPGARLLLYAAEVPAGAPVQPGDTTPRPLTAELQPTSSLLELEVNASRTWPKRRPSIPESLSQNPRQTRGKRLASPGTAKELYARDISPQPAAGDATAIAAPQARRRPSLYARSVSLGNDMLNYVRRLFRTPSSDNRLTGTSHRPTSAAGRELEPPDPDILTARFPLLPFPLLDPQQGQKRAGEEVELEDLGRKT